VNRALACGFAALVLGCGGLLGVTAEKPASPNPPPPVPTPALNFLVVIADDVGVDKVAAYGEHPRPATTPHIDRLAHEGMWFRNAYTSPVCSASRANLLTGRYGRRNGMGGIVGAAGETWELPLSEVTLPELLRAADPRWSTAAYGKWHLSGPRTAHASDHPNLQGFQHYAGALTNISITSRASKGREAGYFAFEKTVDGHVGWRDGVYATTDTTDDAVAWLDAVRAPFFLVVAYHAVHEPHHVPPAALLHGPPPSPDAPDADLFDAALEAMDTELGRLLDSLDDVQRASTVVVFVGDNGTERRSVRPPLDGEHAKATLYEGGTNVPFIVVGPGIVPGVADALVHTVDLFPTVAALTGVATGGLVLDGVSFAPVLADPSDPGDRTVVYTERFGPLGPGPYDLDVRAVRDARFKVFDRGRGPNLWFDLRGRNDDGPPITNPDAEQRAGFQQLEAELRRLRETLAYDAR
jgi:arylsulfatase A-like enzyme